MGADGLGETSMVRAIWLFNSPDLSLSPLSMFYLCSYLHICTRVHVAVRVKLGCSFVSCCPLHVLRQALSLGGWLGAGHSLHFPSAGITSIKYVSHRFGVLNLGLSLPMLTKCFTD